MPKKIIREEKYLMLIKQISEIEKELSTFKSLSDKKEKEIQKFMNETFKSYDEIIKNLKLFEDIATIHTNLHTQNNKKRKILEWLINFNLGINLGILILLVFLKMKGTF